MRHRVTGATSLALAVMAGPAWADTVTLSVVVPAEVAAGASTEVAIGVEKAQGLGALQLIVTYDPALLEAGQVEPGEIFSGLVESNVAEPGRLRVALVTSEAVNEDGELVRLRFTARQAGAAAIGLEEARAWEQASGQEMSVGVAGGTLAISGGRIARTPALRNRGASRSRPPRAFRARAGRRLR